MPPMAQKKLIRFAAIKGFANVLENPTGMAGKWGACFKNNHPITLELACGRGEYTVALSKLSPLQNFIGIDIKGNRIYIGAKKCLEENLMNAFFVRTQIQHLPLYFAAEEVEEIWLTFPDPHLRTSKAKNRLTYPRFLRLYRQVLKPGGCIHLKTDSPALYLFTKRVAELYGLIIVEDIYDVFAQQTMKEELKIKTHYESLDIAGSNKIFYLKFQLPALIPDLDDALMEELKQTENCSEIIL